jgi:hypothetical protein
MNVQMLTLLPDTLLSIIDILEYLKASPSGHFYFIVSHYLYPLKLRHVLALPWQSPEGSEDM